MPITVVQSKVALITSASNTHQLKFDANVTPGNWIVFVWRRGTSSRTPGVPAPSAGTWSGSQDYLAWNGSTASVGDVYQWSGQHTGTATDTYTITIASSQTSIGAIVGYELSGVDVSGTPRGGSGTQVLSSSASFNLIASPGITLNSGDIIIGAATAISSWSTLTAPSGFSTELLNMSTGGITSTCIGSRTTSGTGITGGATSGIARANLTGYMVYLQDPGSGPTTISVSDTGAGNDATPVVACALIATDSGSSSDAPSISCSLVSAETSSGSDATPSIGCAASQSESGSAADSANISCSLAQADGGAGADTLAGCAVSLSLLESSQASDFLGALNVLLAAITDSAAGTDVIVQIQQGILIALADSGLGSDAITSLACSLTTTDSVAGTDAVSCSVLLQQILDACVGADLVASSVLISVPDSGAGSDAPVCTVQLSLSDTASGLDLLTALAVVLGVADQAGGSDAISINTGGGGSSGRVATVTFTARGKSAAFSPDSKSTTFTPNL